MSVLSPEDQQLWDDFYELINEAKQLLHLTETTGDTTDLHRLRTLADKGLEILLKVQDFDICMLDLELMSTLVKILKYHIRTATEDCQQEYRIKKFAKKVLGYADVPFEFPKGSRSSSLRVRKKLFDLCHSQLCYQAPLYSTGTGALKNPQQQAGNKEKNLHQKKKHDTHASPQVISNTSGTTVERSANHLADILNRCFDENNKQPLNYLKFIIDPTDFSATVENIFNISFLVNTGHVNIYIDDTSKMPMVEPTIPAEQDVTRKNKAAMVIQISYEEWLQAIELFNIREPMIKVPSIQIVDPNQPSTSGMAAQASKKRKTAKNGKTAKKGKHA